ncbi:FHA domain-containing protein [Streptomyces sp. NPDC058279]|uniref:FHA domain-containing protein n=1 Tax=Streptomyces sp. NPDC058279 TaxID=3346418 RepID=UPI0036ECF7FC
MQIRLTVLGSRSGHQTATAPAGCDVLVTAPAGTALAAVASALAATVGGPDTGGTVVLYAGAERLDPQRRMLGEPPLVDGAVLALHMPVPDVVPALPEEGLDAPQLRVVAGPDAGGVHLLHPGAVRIGRSSDADVPLDDPDVSRLHCTVTVLPDGRVTVADLGSTNGTTLDGASVGARAVSLAPGSLLRVGESTLRLAAGNTEPVLPLTPDTEGHLALPGVSDGVREPDAGRPAAGGHAAPGAEADGRYEASAAGTTGHAGYSGHGDSGTGSTSGAGRHDGPGAGAHGEADVSAGRGGPAGLIPHPAPSRNGGSAPDPEVPHAGSGQDGGVRPGAAGTAWPTAGPDTATPYRAAPAQPATGWAADAPDGPGSGGAPRPPVGGYPGASGSGRPAPAPAASGASHPGGPGTGRPEPDRPDASRAPHPSAAHHPGAPRAGWSAVAAAGPEARPGGTPYPGAHGGPASDPGPGRPGGTSYPGPHGPAAPSSADGPGAQPAGTPRHDAHGVPAPDPGRRPDGGAVRSAPAGPEARSGAAHVPHGEAARTAWPTPAHGSPAPQGPRPGAPGAGGRPDPLSVGGGTPRVGAPAAVWPTPGGSAVPAGAGRRRGIGAWARKWVRGEDIAEPAVEAEAPPVAPPAADDPAALLLAALGPTGRLWSRPPGALDVGLGAGSRVDLREAGALGIAGPRPRLTGVARSVIAQLAALHSPAQLEIVLLAMDPATDWNWVGWLPHVRPAHGQHCRLLLAHDREQAAARTGELTRRLDDSPLGTGWATAGPEAVRRAASAYEGPYTLVVLDGDPGTGALREVTARLASHGPAAGVHLLALAEAPAATPASPLAETYEAACASTPAFRACGAVAVLSGEVATAVRTFPVSGGAPVRPGTTAVADAVSAAWAERFARALAPLRAEPVAAGGYRPAAVSLPQTSRLLDELGLARATPASLMARWAAATGQGQTVGGLAEAVLGAGRRGPVGVELVHDGPHLLIEGPPGSGRTELLRSIAASLSAGARPDRLGLLLIDGAGGERGEGLLPCTELPHVSAHLVASDPLRMREFAQALGAELKRRHELLDGVTFTEWHARREVSDRMVSPRRPAPEEGRSAARSSGAIGDEDSQRTGTLRLRASAPRTGAAAGPGPLPRLVVLVDDFDALVAPGLGSTGRPAAGSVVRILEGLAREGARLGVHLVATSARPDRTAGTEPARLATLRVELDAPDQPGPGRGLLHYADGRTVPFQGGRVTGRIPRTATSRPTVVPLEWRRMGDPPARRPVRELGNGPTDLALLASALDRASHLVSAIPVLFPAAP